MELFSSRIRHLFFNSNILYCLRILIALCGTTLAPWLLHQPTLTIPLTLGVVAAALTDLDDRFTGRLFNLFITLLCFIIASVSVEFLMPYPWLMAIGILLSTGSFIMLGALGQRYATIAFGALLIAIYTMLGSSMYENWYIQPILLLSGALWYNLLTLLGHIILPIRPLQENVSQCFFKLVHYLDSKAMLFDPDEENEFHQQSIDLAMSNSRLVETLNQTKSSLFTRLRSDRGQKSTRLLLHYYFIAQDIHEQISSAHVRYQVLSKAFRYSDILFRFQRLLILQAQSCRKIAQSILYQERYTHDSYFEKAQMHLEQALQRLEKQSEYSSLINSLRLLLNNLKAIDTQLNSLSYESISQQTLQTDNILANDNISGLKDIIQRITHQFTPESPLFRHAVRMSFVLCVSYLIIQLANLEHGYWILLTSLFVCQPNYNATKRRLMLRIAGTLTGILLGVPILYFIPSIKGQLTLIVISGVLFFAFRSVRYAQATMFITLLVLLCFNLLGQGFDIIIPRIIDTVIGCLIAWIAVNFIWPDWNFRRLSIITDKTMLANNKYFQSVISQYHYGRNNNLDYRVARRDAHNYDAELASIMSTLSAEPKKNPVLIKLGFRFLYLNQNLLSYISALGAHRSLTSNSDILRLLDKTQSYLNDTLTKSLHNQQEYVDLVQITDQFTVPSESKEQLILQQLSLIFSVITELVTVKQHILMTDNMSTFH